MRTIIFDSANISDIQNKFRQENNELLEEFMNFGKELYEVESLLNTPKSSIIIPKQLEILEKMKEYIIEKDTYFENIFNMTKNEYNDLIQNIKSMVGADDE